MNKLVRVLRDLDVIAIDRIWRRSPEASPASPPSWTLPADLDVRIRWPKLVRWPEADVWLLHLRAGLSKLATVEDADLPQDCHDRAVVLEFVAKGQAHKVVVDFSDYADEIASDALDDAACYFKWQYREGGYGHARIVPGGYGVSTPYMYRYLKQLRRAADRKKKLCNVSGRFGLRYAAEIRSRAVELLSSAADLDFEGGTQLVRTIRYLMRLARTKIGIDMPGNGDLCFRLFDNLAIGTCVIGRRPKVELPVPLVDREHVIFCADDLSDLVPLCRHYLAHDGERQRIARNGRDYFDRYMHRDQLARYYLHEFSRLVSD